ncbi:MAG: glycosyltransferase, exosortase A system-associated [Candidatus Omnitrophica bacterium]|jgi:PEP-CTERM/exosortase A-associated glycosyltransferase|nr:glycosyltransferase, exosortase A system-associated [Candidatus Omnitrophota bacterium]
MASNLKIYHILDHFIPEYSGYTFRSRSILNTQKSLGINPTGIISPLYSKGLLKEEKIEGIEFYRSLPNGNVLFSKIPFVNQLITMEHFKKDIHRILKDKPKGIIHAHSPILNALPAYSVARKLSMPFVYEVRAFWEDAAVDLGKTKEKSLRYRITKYLETNILKKADRIVTICEGLKQDMIGRGVDSKKIWVVPNGVDLSFFKPQDKNVELIKKYNLTGKTIIGFIGSFYKYEGLDLLIKAAPKIIKNNENVVFMLVGAGPQDKFLKDFVKYSCLDNHFIFPGKVPHSEIVKYYSIMDLLVYPRISIRLTELVTPLKPLEAMAMQKAVIGSDIGGIREIIGDNTNGLLFEPSHPEDLADKCNQLINHIPRREELSIKGFDYVSRTRHWNKIIEKHFEVYKNLLN